MKTVGPKTPATQKPSTDSGTYGSASLGRPFAVLVYKEKRGGEVAFWAVSNIWGFPVLNALDVYSKEALGFRHGDGSYLSVQIWDPAAQNRIRPACKLWSERIVRLIKKAVKDQPLWWRSELAALLAKERIGAYFSNETTRREMLAFSGLNLPPENEVLVTESGDGKYLVTPVSFPAYFQPSREAA